MIKEARNFSHLYAEWIGEGLRPVAQEQAQHRANTCLACPMHIQRPIWEFFAGQAADAVKRQIELKNTMKLRVQGEKSLHICGGCNCILRLKIWSPIEFISDTTPVDNLVAACWIRKEMAL